MRRRKRPLRARPMRTGIETLHQLVARLMFLGWPATRIARRLHRTPRAIRYLVGSPEFQVVYTRYEAEQLATIDRALPSLLLAALEGLQRLVRHPEVSVRQHAIEVVLEHTQLLEKLSAARPTPAGGGDGGRALDDMTPEERQAAQVLLQGQRHRQGPKPMAPGLTDPNADHNRYR